MDSIRSLVQIVLTFIAFIWGILRAPVLFIGGALSRVFAWYKKLWIKYTHNKYEEFVYKRGLAMAAATVAGIVVIPTVVCLFLQTGYYLATYKKEKIYLIQSEEIYPDDNTWAVRGCYTKNCDSDSSLYYRISPSLFHHLWNLSHKAIFSCRTP